VRILFLSTSMGMGGADSQLIAAARELQGRGHQVRILSLTALGPMGYQAQGFGLEVESLEMRRGVPDPRGFLRAARIIRAWRPDVVHSHMVHANLMARVLRLVAPIPVLVSTIHNIYEAGEGWMWGYRLTNGLVDHMTIISQMAAERHIRDRIVPSRILRVVPNGVDATPFLTVPPEIRGELRASLGVSSAFVWLAVGRFEVAKDYPNMLRAFARARERHPAAVLLLVGKGSLREETEAVARELGLGESVRFLGVRSDVPAVVSAADGYVMSSAWEGMPMVLLEAAAGGLPIVTTRVGGNEEAVLDGETGYLAPPRDDAALAAAMVRLMELPEDERRLLGARGRELIRTRYALTKVADRWEELYREVSTRKGITLQPSPSRP
jgi:glycosyltransferase involved in cell wall biosynthesis